MLGRDWRMLFWVMEQLWTVNPCKGRGEMKAISEMHSFCQTEASRIVGNLHVVLTLLRVKYDSKWPRVPPPCLY